MHPLRRLGPILVVVTALVAAAACGSPDDSNPDPNASGDFTLDEPVTFALLAEVSGESAVAVDDYNNAAEMAVKDINDRGGIGGHPVRLVRTTAPLTPQGAVTAYLTALEENPTVILGYPANTQVAAAAAQIKQNEIPFISLANVEPTLVRGQPASSEWLYQLRASDNVESAVLETEYAIKELGATKIGIMYVDVASSLARVAGVKDKVAELGGTVVAERKHTLTTNDLTGDVIAMKSAGAEAVVALTYPNQLAVAVQQFAQNALDVPLLGTTSAETMVVNGLVGSAPLDNLYGILDCNVSEKSPDWAQRYTQTYGLPASDISSGTYDAFMFAASAIQAARSTDPNAVREALDKTKYTDGVCSDNMYGDAEGIVQHGMVMVNFAGGTMKTVGTYETD